ncbi:MAG: hypothetical protein KGH89_04215 [Thaumarchaeota archaeon]|nr:hypothetical protein [Nitrososphaerota archaeon]MDE1867643.1 hypothetical protein [Nitrososphaerota archaeon]
MHKDRGVCKGLCKQYKVRKPRDGTSRYLSDQVRCQICGIFMAREGCHDIEEKPVTSETVGLYCNCCNCMVRSKPRNKPGMKNPQNDSPEKYQE